MQLRLRLQVQLRVRPTFSERWTAVKPDMVVPPDPAAQAVLAAVALTGLRRRGLGLLEPWLAPWGPRAPVNATTAMPNTAMGSPDRDTTTT